MSTLQAIADILQKSLNLTDEQVWTFNQRRNIPTTSGLCIVVGRMGLKPYSNNTHGETASQTFQEVITLNVFSRNTDAITQVGPIVAALASEYSQLQQQTRGFQIARVPTSVMDASALEGAAMLTRAVITVNVLTCYEQTVGTTYFDPDTIDFNVEETEA